MTASTRFLTPLLLPLLLAACDISTRTQTLEFEGDITQITVDTGSGDIEVLAKPGVSDVHVEAVITGRDTELISSVEDGQLVLDHTCPPVSTSCAVDWYLVVPQREDGTDLLLDTGSGDVDVDAHVGSVIADSGSGNVHLRAVHAEVVSVETGSGDLTLTDCVAEDVVGKTGSGDMEVEIGEAPQLVSLESGSGDALLRLPGGEYRLNLSTGSGDVSVEGVAHDNDADRYLKVETGSGDIEIRGG